MHICERIRAIRQEKGILAKDVAEHLGVAGSTYCLLETGQRRLRADHVQKIADALQVPVGELYGEDRFAGRGERGAATGKSAGVDRQLRPIDTPELRRRIQPVLGDLTEEVIQCFELGIRVRSREKGRVGEG